MVATAERVGKVARIGGRGFFFLANSGNARIETFFLFCTCPLYKVIFLGGPVEHLYNFVMLGGDLYMNFNLFGRTMGGPVEEL